MANKITTYREFWPYYLAEHRRPATRLLHYIGTGVGIAFLIAFALTANLWFVPCAIVAGYAFAWAGHAFVEHNRPATFTYPTWSLVSDFRMFFLALSGGLGKELDRHAIDQVRPR